MLLCRNCCLYIIIIQKIAPQAKSGKYFQIWFSPDLGRENGVVLSMRMQVILSSLFAHPVSAPIWRGGKKGEYMDWTTLDLTVAKLHQYGADEKTLSLINPTSLIIVFRELGLE